MTSWSFRKKPREAGQERDAAAPPGPAEPPLLERTARVVLPTPAGRQQHRGCACRALVGGAAEEKLSGYHFMERNPAAQGTRSAEIKNTPAEKYKNRAAGGTCMSKFNSFTKNGLKFIWCT